MSIKVSVILPVYNCKKFLDNSIKSVIEQSCFDLLELILVDDGSSDGSAEICDSYSEKYDNIVSLHQKNSGVSVARNTGIEAAKGEYITFLDSDDRYENDYIKELLNCAKNDLVCCDYYCKSDDEKNLAQILESKIYTRENFNFDFYRKIIRQEFYSCWNKLYKKSIIDDNNIRFIPGVKYAEDMIFVFEYLKHCDTFFFIDKPLYFYNVNPENTTSVVKNGFDVQKFIYDYQNKYFSSINCDRTILNNVAGNFVYKTTCMINSEITHYSFTEAYKYVKKVLASSFYELYIKENYTEFNCFYDKVFFNLLKKRMAFLTVLWRKLFDLRSKISNE